MGFNKRAGCFGFVLLFASAAWAQTEKNAEIFVRVLNHAGIARKEMIRAEREAARIFRAAGLEIQWVDCSREDCHRLLAANEFVLNVVPDGKTSTDLVFGIAFLGPSGEGKYADVFFRRIEAAFGSNAQNISRMLGTVSAHELGHLLLGSHAHSGAGIMMASWGAETVCRVEMGSLLFTRDQAALMRARVGGNGVLLAGGAKSNENVRSGEAFSMSRGDFYMRAWRTRYAEDTR